MLNKDRGDPGEACPGKVARERHGGIRGGRCASASRGGRSCPVGSACQRGKEMHAVLGSVAEENRGARWLSLMCGPRLVRGQRAAQVWAWRRG